MRGETGLVDMIYMLMKAVQTVLKNDSGLKFAIRNTIDKILNILDIYGCLRVKSLEEHASDNQCFGQPSSIPMFLMAAQLFPALKERLELAALQLGRQLWTFGLVIDGKGLKNGITANGYYLHCLFRYLDRPEHVEGKSEEETEAIKKEA